MDEELRKAFSELQIKAVETAQRVQQAENEIDVCKRSNHHSLLTERELSALPDDTRVYESYGAFYLLEPLHKVRESLIAKAAEKDEKIKSLEAHKDYLNKSVKEDEDNLREINAAKSRRRTHQERHQPRHRRKLGLLEKHKDYMARAREYHRKETQLKILREKARNRNPDEFYYKMVSSRVKDGKHFQPTSDDFTDEELKVLKTQDASYTTLRRSQEAKKIERLQGSLHLLTDHGGSPLNKHTIFVHSKQDVEKFDAAQHFDTVPELLGRTYNRPRLQTLKSKAFVKMMDEQTIERAEREKAAGYEELSQRIHREKRLARLMEEQELQKHLLEKGDRWKIKGADGRVMYKWKKQRKR